jgi:hypothetical protein
MTTTRALAACSVLMLPAAAWAYVDPNAGGLLLQLLAPLLAAIAGGWLFLRRAIADWCRRVWHRLTGRSPQ